MIWKFNLVLIYSFILNVFLYLKRIFLFDIKMKIYGYYDFWKIFVFLDGIFVL